MQTPFNFDLNLLLLYSLRTFLYLFVRNTTSPPTGDLEKRSDLKPKNFEHQSKVSEYGEHLIMIDHDTD